VVCVVDSENFKLLKTRRIEFSLLCQRKGLISRAGENAAALLVMPPAG
jgi:hypothetical protein